MVLRIPETGLQLESSAKIADTLPLQAFAITLSDNVIEDLIQCVQNGDDIRLSLGKVPSFLYGQEVHKLSEATEITDLDLYLTDPSDSTQHAERFPLPTMSVFMKPPLSRYPRLGVGREVAREKTASKASAAGRKAHTDLPDDFQALKKNIEKEQKAKMEHSTKIVDASLSGTGAKRPAAKVGKGNKLLPSKGGAMSGAIGRSAPASPALSGINSPSLGPTLSGAEQAKDEARELRAPIVHQLAIRAMSFEELRSKWPGQETDFKPALDKAAEFDSGRQKYNLKKMYWKELNVFKYDYDSDEDRQAAIDNAIRMYDRSRMSASEPVWDRLLPKEERGKGKCLSKLLPTIASTAAKTPQIKVTDGDESSGSKNGDASPSGTESKKVVKKTSQPMSRQSSQTKKPAAKKIERKWVGKKETTPKVSPAKAGGKTTSGKFKSKEFISDSDSSSEEAPLAKTAPRAKDKENEKEREKERERQKERERDREREREREKEKLERQRERDREAAAAPKPRPKPAAPKESVKPQVIARPTTQKRPREEADDDSSSSSSTPLKKRVNREREPRASVPAHTSVSHKRPPSDASSQSSSRSSHSHSNSTGYAGAGYTTKNKNTSPVKSSPLASSPPTNASDLDHHQQQRPTVDERRHERERDRSRDRSVTVANGTSINVAKKRKMEAADGDAIDVSAASAVAEKKRQRLSTDVLNDARKFKQYYDVYQRLHHELSSSRFSAEVYQDKYDKLLKQRKRLEDLKKSIYAQIPQECY